MLNIKTEEEYITIVEMFSDMIFRIAYQNLFDTHDAEDVVQDVFLKLLKQKEKCFHDYEHLKSWLIRVTINQCLDYKKSFFRKNTVPLEDFDISYEPEEKEIMEELYQLPKDYRNILYLYYYEDFTIKEIANSLNLTESNVKNYIYRTLKELRRINND